MLNRILRGEGPKMESMGTKGSTGKGNALGKGNTQEKRVEECERKYAREGPEAGMLNREVRDKTESTRN